MGLPFRQIRAIWAHAGALRKFGRILKHKAVLRGAADVGTDVALKGVKMVQRSKKGGIISRAFRSKKFRKGQFVFDIGTSVGFAGLGVKELLDTKKTNAARSAAVRRFEINLNRTEQRLRRVRRVGQ